MTSFGLKAWAVAAVLLATALALAPAATPPADAFVGDASGAGDAGATGTSWRARRAFLVQRHPLYGRVLSQADLPAARRWFLGAQALPASARLRVAYLIQGEEDTESKQAAMWGPDADVFVITFRTRRRDALFFPRSLLAEGRNILLGAAGLQELRTGLRYTYYVMLDADVEAALPWTQALHRFETFLDGWRPAVGLPAFGAYGDAAGSGDPENSGARDALPASEDYPRSVFHFDHIFVAVHSEAAPALLPYASELDGACAWVSQWRLSLLATALFRRRVALLPSVRVLNPSHSKYPKDECLARMANASAELRGKAPPEAAGCFPAPVAGLVHLAGSVRRFAYVSLGDAEKKGTGALEANYSRATLAAVASCDDEVFAEAVRAEELAGSGLAAPECQGCSPAATFLTLQAATAAMPRSERNWNALGAWLYNAAATESSWRAQVEVYLLAGACFAVARRLLLLSGRPPNELVEQNADATDRLLAERGLQKPVDSEEFWTQGGHRAKQALRSVLTVADWQRAGLEDPRLMSEETLETFVAWLVGG
eukprot:TRINITY_DN15790_c0_g2_i1.p1 TRINITY_DN15790_c0_g2~~TRINITY_DN15790_c0_g2_i1.p1  ORF type:complete len:569 (-),score=110.70 TRINITY_DN15790_c0_g2_i1:137-1765(-)